MTDQDQSMIECLHRTADAMHGIDNRARLRQIADRLHDLASLEPTPAPPGSVPVRIAVAIDENGTIGAWPQNKGMNDNFCMQEARDAAFWESSGNGTRVYTHEFWLVGTVPPRVVPVVTGEAVAFDTESTK